MSETNKSWTGNIQTTEQKPKGHIDSGSDSNKTTEVMTTKEVNQNCKDGDKENRPFIGGKLETLMKKLKQELREMQRQDVRLLRQLMQIHATLRLLGGDCPGRDPHRRAASSSSAPGEAEGTRDHRPLRRESSEPLRPILVRSSTAEEAPVTDLDPDDDDGGTLRHSFNSFSAHADSTTWLSALDSPLPLTPDSSVFLPSLDLPRNKRCSTIAEELENQNQSQNPEARSRSNRGSAHSSVFVFHESSRKTTSTSCEVSEGQNSQARFISTTEFSSSGVFSFPGCSPERESKFWEVSVDSGAFTPSKDSYETRSRTRNSVNSDSRNETVSKSTSFGASPCPFQSPESPILLPTNSRDFSSQDTSTTPNMASGASKSRAYSSNDMEDAFELDQSESPEQAPWCQGLVSDLAGNSNGEYSEYEVHYETLLKSSVKIWKEIQVEKNQTGSADKKKIAALKLFL